MSASSATDGANPHHDYRHRLAKYLPELTFMLREFEKLESQLLQGGGNGEFTNVDNDSAQKSRREKLRAFIVHITDVKSQLKSITSVDETKGKGSHTDSATAAELEQHILTSLLPVKDRLKKQLMSNNSAASAPKTKNGLANGTFAASAAKKYQQSQTSSTTPNSVGSVFGKPLGGSHGGSSLTQKLHGRTLGSANRRYGAGVGQHDGKKEVPRQVQYAGMTSRVVGKMDESSKSNESTCVSGSTEDSNQVVMPPPPPSANAMAVAAMRKKAMESAAANAAATSNLLNKRKESNASSHLGSTNTLMEAQVDLEPTIHDTDDENEPIVNHPGSLLISKCGKDVEKKAGEKKVKHSENRGEKEDGPLTKLMNGNNKSNNQSIDLAAKHSTLKSTVPHTKGTIPIPPSSLEVADPMSAQPIEGNAPKPVAKNVIRQKKVPFMATRVPVIKHPLKGPNDVEKKKANAENDSKDKAAVTKPLHSNLLASNQVAKILQSKGSKSSNDNAEPLPKHLDEATVVYLPSKHNKHGNDPKARKKRRYNHPGAHGASGGHSSPGASSVGGSGSLYKKGSYAHHHHSRARSVEYICALCNETYRAECKTGNPWWALTQEACAKCNKTQIPRIDISAPSNAIEYHPALLAHADENNDGGSRGGVPVGGGIGTSNMDIGYDSGSESDESEPGEDFSSVYAGPKLDPAGAAQLLVLMSHAKTCTGDHKSEAHKQVCMSVKYLMLHVRDCSGTSLTGGLCPYPWCRKVKHVLHHLLSCAKPSECPICRPRLPTNILKLAKLNFFKKQEARKRASTCVEVPKSEKKNATINDSKTKSTIEAKRLNCAADEIEGKVQNPMDCKRSTESKLSKPSEVKSTKDVAAVKAAAKKDEKDDHITGKAKKASQPADSVSENIPKKDRTCAIGVMSDTKKDCSEIKLQNTGNVSVLTKDSLAKPQQVAPTPSSTMKQTTILSSNPKSANVSSSNVKPATVSSSTMRDKKESDSSSVPSAKAVVA